MPRNKPDKQALLSDLADHVLKNGLNDASLRPMAAAAGTSDRMLIYHFGNKDALIAEVLNHLASQLATGLDLALPEERFTSEAMLVQRIVHLMRSPEFAPYIRVWLEIVAVAAKKASAHRDAGHAIILTFLEWLAKRHPDGHDGAPRALTLIEGTLIMDAVGHTQITDTACQTIKP